VARRGELLALRWTDVSADGKSITVARALVETANAKARVVEKSTKTNRVRRVPLGVLGAEALRRQKALQAADRLAAGGGYVDSGHVFQMPLGGPISPYLATDAFRNVRARLGLKATLHDLRHTAATWMLNGGIDVRSVAQVLGHTQASTTLAIYSHVLPGAAERAVAAIDERLRRLSS
jgi:integrase